APTSPPGCTRSPARSRCSTPSDRPGEWVIETRRMRRPPRYRFAGLCLAMLALATARALSGEREGAAEPLARGVRPILMRCVECHAGGEPAGGLDLRTRSSAIRGGESGTAIRPKDAAGSLVYRKVATGKMPPKERLRPEQVALIRRWIEAGAEWDAALDAPA